MRSEKWQRALKNGGMLISHGACADVYRSRDARRSAMCVIEKACFTPLISAGLLHRLEGNEDRWIWVASPTGKNTLQAPRVQASKARPSGALEFTLRAEADAARQAYLARAAFRYMSDYEVFHKGTCVTMNWSFVPSGKARQAQRSAGMDAVSLNAGRVLEILNARLNKQEARLLNAILVQSKPVFQLVDDFGVKRDELARLGLGALNRLAEAYDMIIPKERY